MENSPEKSDMRFHTMDEAEALAALDSRLEGIGDDEAAARLKVHGPNALVAGRRKTLVQRFLEQFKEVMVLILLAAAAISGFMGEWTDSAIILVVVVLNAILGVVQESKAEKALEALKKMSTPFVRLSRNGQARQIRTEELVPGDIVFLEAGDILPADLRLVQCASLKIEEAALTGESVPVEKTVRKMDREDLVIGDRRNMGYAGSSVTYGRGIGVVTATGMKTEVGRIAGHLQETGSHVTPLQRKMSEMSRYLTIGILVLSAVIFLAGVLQGRDMLEMFLTSVSLAVAAIPEGLPAVITIVLALGVQRMAKRNAIVRKLSAVETLGSTEIICSDKTGTLTQNRMTVKEAWLDGTHREEAALGAGEGGFRQFVQAMALCNDAKTSGNDPRNPTLIGDPTETALVAFAAGKGVSKAALESSMPRVAEVPFDSDRKLMSTLHASDGHIVVLTKGAPDVLLDRCSRILMDGVEMEITPERLAEVAAANGRMAEKALRVLAVAMRTLPALPDEMKTETVETDLTFIGLVGMIDPPRPEVREAVRVCAEAGIRPVMITGDHRDTAAAIARELGIIKNEGEVITGSQLNEISDAELVEAVDRWSVYARVSPEHKVRIVSAWKKRGRIVAMTGDGVNDAPALKEADIGIGMGITGTEVAKGVSNMVLADDNFATIVVAVEEGRKIYGNIRKTIQFLLSSNLGEITTLFIGTMLNWTVLLPIHILWVNLVTDSLPALALGMEKAESDVMKRRPRKADSSFFSDGVGVSVLYQGVLKGLLTLTAFYLGLRMYSLEVAETMAFATLGLIQLAHSLNARSNDKSLFRIGIFTNKSLNGAIAIAAILQIGVIVIPPLAEIFRVTMLNPVQWGIVLAASLSIIPIVEGVKYVRRHFMAGTKLK